MRVPVAIAVTLVSAGTVGTLTAGAIPGVDVVSGTVVHEGSSLLLSPGTLLKVGEGTSIEVQGARQVELLRGDPDGDCVLAHFGPLSGLYDCDYDTVGDTPRFQWQPEVGDQLGLACAEETEMHLWRRGMQSIVGRGPPVLCRRQPLWIRSPLATPLTALVVDRVPVDLTPTRFHLPGALGAAAIAALASVAFGVAVWPLLLLPASLLGPSLGLPASAVAATIAASAATSAALAVTGWRRALAALLGVVSITLAVGTTLRAPPSTPGWLATWSATRLIDRDLPRQKVDGMVERGRAQLRGTPPRVAIFGSSSSGGSTRGRWWPQILQELRPDVRMVVLAEGGATSWHVREVAEALDLRVDVCITYLGHNDMAVSLPGATLAQLAQGETGTPDQWVAPVTLQEARENYVALTKRCTVLAMEERSLQKGELLAQYRDMLRTVPGLQHADAVSALAATPRAMMDDIHLTPRGGQALAEFVAEELRPLLDKTATESSPTSPRTPTTSAPAPHPPGGP